jgi:hypothetical protein
MMSMSCPNCGAPGQAIPGQNLTHCTYCKQAFQTAPFEPPPQPAWGPPPPPMSPPPVQPILIVPPGETYAAASAVAAGWVGFRLVMAIIPIVVIAMVGGILWFSMRTAAPAGFSGLSTSMGGANPVVCGSNDSVNVTGLSVSGSGPGITAGGNCHVQCVGCSINAVVGVVASGNADVQLVDSHVAGSAQAIVASGNATVRMTGGSTLSGRVIKTDNATVVAPQSVTPPPTTPVAVPRPPATVPPTPTRPPPGPSPTSRR